jgi:hypothetical protein
MIDITLYKNGFKIEGHSEPKTCGEVSILAWACANSIGHIDKSSYYYTSWCGNKENPNEGLTYFVFDIKNDAALWIYEDYKHNAKVWGDTNWKDVIFNYRDDETLAKIDI